MGTFFDERKMPRLACCVDFIVLKKGTLNTSCTHYIFPKMFVKDQEL